MRLDPFPRRSSNRSSSLKPRTGKASGLHAQDRASLVCFNVDGACLSPSSASPWGLAISHRDPPRRPTGPLSRVPSREAATRTIWPPWSIRTTESLLQALRSMCLNLLVDWRLIPIPLSAPPKAQAGLAVFSGGPRRGHAIRASLHAAAARRAG